MQPFVVLASLSASAAATGICPFLGPVFPAARSLATDAAFQATIRGLGAGLQEALSTGNSSFGSLNPNDTYSVQVFSTRDEKPLLDFHRRGIDVVGSRVIDGDSVYRIASTTKLITVYLLLLHAGDDILGHSVTRYLPELAQGPHWPEVTIGSLAGYMSGVASERKPYLPAEYASAKE